MFINIKSSCCFFFVVVVVFFLGGRGLDFPIRLYFTENSMFVIQNAIRKHEDLLTAVKKIRNFLQPC